MIIHVVQAGESLWQISNRYGVSIPPIVAANGLTDPNNLVIGQALLIPSADTVHIVRPGETLWQIAREYGVSLRVILQNNRIPDPSALTPGQVIYIPATRHTVAPGETMWAIAQRYNVPLQELIMANPQVTDPNVLSPGMVLVIPSKPRPMISVNAYIYIFGEDAVPVVGEVGELLTYLSPFAYLIREDASLEPIDDEPAIREAVARGAVPMMALTNFTATSRGENLASVILNSPELTETLLTNILAVMEEKGYEGLNVDFENVLPADREAYNRFLEQAVRRLRPRGYFVSTAVAPKTGPTQGGLLYEAHDYPAHGRIVDFVVLMTYEWGYRKGPPQAISPINQIRRVLDYAVTVIPRDKIYLGFQIYARDWTLPFTPGSEARTFSPQEAVELAARYGARIQYQESTASPFFRYYDEQGREHEVWFEDARSAKAKFDLVKEYGLAGISYWALGYPFPQNWVLLEDTFNIRRE